MLSLLRHRASALSLLIGSLLLATAPLPGADLDLPPRPPLSIPKAPEPKEVELETEVDLVKLLNRDLVFPNAASLTDSIWQLEANPGRTIVRIPLSVSKPDTEIVVSGSAMKVRGGRFICWQLIDPTEEITGVTTPLASGAAIRPNSEDTLPPGVPRIARSVRLDTQGKVHWKMERAIPGAKVVETTPGAYNIKLSPAVLETINPGNPPRTLKNAGESIADFNKRKQPIEEEYRKKLALYRDTRLMLSKLPDEFSGPLPPTLWAVYEARANSKSVEFDGPAPLPWEFSLDLLHQLQRVMKSAADGKIGEVSTELGQAGLTFSTTPVEKELLKALEADKVHPYTVRLVAHALTLSTYLANMEEGDGKYQVVAKILEAKDSKSTGELMKYLAVRPSKASASLMAKALKDGLLDAKAQLSSVLGMISTLGSDTNASIDSALQIINRYLADAKGPPVTTILTPMFKLAKEKPALADPIAKGLRIDATGERRDEILLAILAAAVTDPVAMSLVDGRLLGSEDEALVERTLYLISRAQRPKVDLTFTGADGNAIALAPAAAGKPSPVVVAFWSTTMAQPTETIASLSGLSVDYAAKGVRFVTINLDSDKARFENFVKESKLTLPTVWDEKGFDGEYAKRFAVMELPQTIITSADGQFLWRGRHSQLEKNIAHALAPAKTATAATDNEPRPMLLDDIGIQSNDHTIFRLLASAKLRNLAWGALRQMKMMPSKTGASADREKWTTNVLSLAITQTPTPVAAVAFLAKHDEPGVPQALTQLVLRGDGDASKAASLALLGSGWSLEPVINGLTSEADRHAFGLRFYENIQGEAPYSVNLLRDKADSTSSAAWFARQISSGSLPHAAEWAVPYQGEDRLLLLVSAGDEQLAMGAIGTLVASAGGAGPDVEEVATKMRGNKNATIPEITRLWATLRKDLFTTKLKKASANYTLSMRTGTADRNNEVIWNMPRPVGTVAMKVEGEKVALNTAAATIPADESLSIVLSGKDLAALAPALATGGDAIKVAGDQPLAFTPRGHDGWVAQFAKADGTRVELILTVAQ